MRGGLKKACKPVEEEENSKKATLVAGEKPNGKCQIKGIGR
jgi:hypothetical protein